MTQLTHTEWLVLNATADDAENLEQIYRSVAFECSRDPDHPADPDSCCWREARPPILLGEIADAIRSLVARGLLIRRWDPAELPLLDDLSYVWKAWFEMSEAGRSLWRATEEPSRQPVATPSE
jgi:hypothetical protein